MSTLNVTICRLTPLKLNPVSCQDNCDVLTPVVDETLQLKLHGAGADYGVPFFRRRYTYIWFYVMFVTYAASRFKVLQNAYITPSLSAGISGV